MNEKTLGLLLLLILIAIAFYFLIIKSSDNVKHGTIKEVQLTSEVEVGVSSELHSEADYEQNDGKPLRLRANASWYGRETCQNREYGVNCKTANGEIFDEEAFTMACSYDFSLGDTVELCYNNKCAIARCTDRGDFERLGRTFDLSRGLFQYFSELSVGVIEVEWESR